MPCFIYCLSSVVIVAVSVAIVAVSVAIECTSALCCVCRDLKIFYHERVFLTFIANSECCVVTLLSFVVTYNLPWSCHKLKCLSQHEKFCLRHFVLICFIVLLFFYRDIKLLCRDKG